MPETGVPLGARLNYLCWWIIVHGCARDGHTPTGISAWVPFLPCYRQFMQLDPTARRRWLGGLALVVAGAMLIFGLTLLQGRLGPSGFILYWAVCFLFLGLAVLIALRDFRTLQQKARAEHRELLESTLSDIEAEVRRKARKPGRNGRP